MSVKELVFEKRKTFETKKVANLGRCDVRKRDFQCSQLIKEICSIGLPLKRI